MGFGFGGVQVGTKGKYLSKATDDYILVNNFVAGEPYYLFLLEGKTNPPSALTKIKKKIDDAGYKSYIIASATNGVYKDSEVSQKYEYIKSNPTNWKSLITYNDVHCSAIMPFGIALYAVNKGTDILVDAFYDTKMNKPYYYLGHGFIGDYDTFIFPVDGAEKLYPTEYKKGKAFKPDESNVNWRTRFFFEQLENMQKEKVLPDDMSDYKIIVANDDVEPDPNSRVIKHYTKDILKSLMNSDVLAWDTETNSLRWYYETSTIGCITLSNDGKTGYYIPAKYILNNEENKKLLCEVFYSCNTMVGANIKFDLHYLCKQIPELDMFKIKHIDDVGQLSHCINSDRTKGLKSMTYFYTPFGGYEDELDNFKKQTKIDNYLLIPQNILSKYATIDTIVTYRIFFALLKHLKWLDETFPNEKPIDASMSSWYNNIMTRAYPYFTRMEHHGMMVDYDYVLDVRNKLIPALQNYKDKLCKIWGVPEDFKFNSTTELGKLFEKLGWPCVSRSASGLYATSDECIKEWTRQKMPGIKEFIKLREVNSFLGTFIGLPSDDGNKENATGWEKFIIYHPEDNSYRIHQSYLIMGTETMRCIGRDPNLQNVPVHSPLASEINRSITVPTALIYKIKCDNGVYVEGTELDTVLVVGKGRQRIPLKDITEDDTIVPDSFEKYQDGFESYFNELTDDDDKSAEGSWTIQRCKLYGFDSEEDFKKAEINERVKENYKSFASFISELEMSGSDD